MTFSSNTERALITVSINLHFFVEDGIFIYTIEDTSLRHKRRVSMLCAKSLCTTFRVCNHGQHTPKLKLRGCTGGWGGVEGCLSEEQCSFSNNLIRNECENFFPYQYSTTSVLCTRNCTL